MLDYRVKLQTAVGQDRFYISTETLLMNYKKIFITLLSVQSPTALMANDNKNGKDLCNYCKPVWRGNQSTVLRGCTSSAYVKH